MHDNDLSFFWQWRNANGYEKDAICEALEVTRGYLSSVANGKPSSQILKMALSKHLETDVTILFPAISRRKREHEPPFHRVNRHTAGSMA